MNEIIKFKNYQPTIKGRKLFSPLSFSLCRNDFLIIRAPSGSGKTKWLEDIVYDNSDSINRNGTFTYLPQALDLVKNLSIINNALLGCISQLSWWKTILSRKNVLPFETVKKDLTNLGLSDFEKSTLYLSGGEQQRLAVVRTTQAQADIWILDEPVSQLDPEWAQKVFDYIYEKSRQKNVAVICVLHQELNILDKKDTKTLSWNEGWVWEKK